MKIKESAETERIGVSAVQLQFTKLGYIFREQTISDYGIDAQIELKIEGEASGKLIGLQIKSGDSYFGEESDDYFVFRGKIEHLKYWIEHSLPVIIILHNLKSEISYWQSISNYNVQRTKSGWKIKIPKNQKINAGIHFDLKRLVYKYEIPQMYSIASFDDVSHGNAKRYSARIILNKEYSQIDIIELIKFITREFKEREYYRNEIVKDRWKDHLAQVVFLFVYPSIEDEKNNNFLCRTQWIFEDLAKEYSPNKLDGEDIGEGVIVDWNQNYYQMACYFSENTLTKEAFLGAINNTGDQLFEVAEAAKLLLDKLLNKSIDEEELYNFGEKNWKKVNYLYEATSSLDNAPFECQDLSNRFHSIISAIHNAFLPFSGIGHSAGWDYDRKFYLFKESIKDFYLRIDGFMFELKKVTK